MSAVVTPTRRGALAGIARTVERNLLRIAIWRGERRLQRLVAARCLPSIRNFLAGELEKKRVRLALLEAA